MIIRKAKLDEVEKLIDIFGEKYYRYSGLKDLGLLYDPEQTKKYFTTLMRMNVCIMIVLENESRFLGVIGAILSPWMCNMKQIILTEVFWWIDKNARGNGVARKMITALIHEGKKVGVTHLSLSTMPKREEALKRFYRSLGFNRTDSLFTKEV